MIQQWRIGLGYLVEVVDGFGDHWGQAGQDGLGGGTAESDQVHRAVLSSQGILWPCGQTCGKSNILSLQVISSEMLAVFEWQV